MIADGSLENGIGSDLSNQHTYQKAELEDILIHQVKLTKSQMKVYEVLRGKDEGVTPKELLEELDFAPRTVRYALRKLLKEHIVRRVPNLWDTRQWIYAARPVEKILEEYSGK